MVVVKVDQMVESMDELMDILSTVVTAALMEN